MMVHILVKPRNFYPTEIFLYTVYCPSPFPVLTLSPPCLTYVCHSLAESEHEARMYQIKGLIDKLPDVNKETLKRIIGHLRR